MANMNNVILFVVVIVTGWSMSAGIPGNTCEKITVQFCQGIGYGYTKFPNVFGQRDQSEAGLVVYQYYPIVMIKCSSSMRKFLCSVYIPMCTGTTTVPPCRSLCEKSRNGCEPLMRKFGFPWNFNCLNFPVKNGGQACIAS